MSTPAASRAGALVRAATSVVAVAVLAVGVPVLLVLTIGNPIPTGWSWTTPVTGESLLGLIAALAWIFWGQFLLCLIVEIGAEVRIATGRSADWLSRIPGTFSGQQAMARTLVQAVVAIGIGTAGVTHALAPVVAHADVGGESQRSAVTDAGSVAATPDVAPERAEGAPRTASRTTEPPQTVTVAKGDSLWSIAERHLGSGERWRAIAVLNSGRAMADGRVFDNRAPLRPGWTLLVPVEADSGGLREPGPDVMTVQAGDSLWSMSEAAYGVGEHWGRLFRANRDQIDDPDLIYPGEQLHAPRATSQGRVQAHPDPPKQQSQPSPSPRSPSLTAPDPTAPPSPPPAPARDPIGANYREHTDEGGPDSAVEDGSDYGGDGVTSMRALGGGGLLLASGLFTALLARRRRQFRNRRSGRTISSTPANLVPAQRAVRSRGSSGGEAARFLDLALRDLSARAHRGEITLPEVSAARLSDTTLELVVRDGGLRPAAPWQLAADGQQWRLPRGSELEHSEALAPYPTLVAIGRDDEDATWLVDLEAAGIICLVGDPHACRGLMRFIAAELATNTWSDSVDVVVDDLAHDLIPINPHRLERAEGLDLGRLIKGVRRVREATEATGLDVLAGRADGRGGDTFFPTVLVAATTHENAGDLRADGSNDSEDLADELSLGDGRSTVAYVGVGVENAPGALVLRLDPADQLTMPWAPRLVPNSLSADEAAALGQLFAASQDDDEATGGEKPPNATGAAPTDHVADAAGALREELTQERNGDAHQPHSLLPMPDETYIGVATTTTEDLNALAPDLTPAVAAEVAALDPDLDADLAEWLGRQLSRPRLRVLGPVELQVSGSRPHDVNRRLAYYTELVAYLAFRSKGTTPRRWPRPSTSRPTHCTAASMCSASGWAHPTRMVDGTFPSRRSPQLPEPEACRSMSSRVSSATPTCSNDYVSAARRRAQRA